MDRRCTKMLEAYYSNYLIRMLPGRLPLEVSGHGRLGGNPGGKTQNFPADLGTPQDPPG